VSAHSTKKLLKVNIYYFKIIPFRAGKSYKWSIKEKSYMREKGDKNIYRAFFSRVIRRPAGLAVHNY